MLWVPKGHQRVADAGAVVSGGAWGTALTAGTANVKGNLAQLVASIPFPVTGMIINGESNSIGDGLVDLALNNSTSEIIVNNLLISGRNQRCMSLYVPLPARAGVSLDARCQHTTGAATILFQVTLFGGNNGYGAGLQRCETCGAATANSGGTSVDSGAVQYMKGSYVQLIASTSFAYKWLALSVGNQNNTNRDANSWEFDIAVGGAGSEQNIITNLTMRTAQSGAASDITPTMFSFPCAIPAGSRLSARASGFLTDATDRLFDLVAYGLG